MFGWDLIEAARGSIRILNMMGDKGQPCLIALVIVKDLKRVFEVYTCADGDE